MSSDAVREIIGLHFHTIHCAYAIARAIPHRESTHSVALRLRWARLRTPTLSKPSTLCEQITQWHGPSMRTSDLPIAFRGMRFKALGYAAYSICLPSGGVHSTLHHRFFVALSLRRVQGSQFTNNYHGYICLWRRLSLATVTFIPQIDWLSRLRTCHG